MLGQSSKERSLLLLTAAQLALSFRSGILSPILSLYIRRQGMSITQVGLLGTVSVLGWFIFEPIGGVVADRLQKKWMLAFAIVASTAVYAFYPSANSFTHFLILYFVTTSVMSAYSIAMKALQAELLPSQDRGKTFGRYLSVISFGGVVSPLIGGWMTENMGYAVPFYAAAAIGVVGLAAVLLMSYDDKPDGHENNIGGGWRELFTAPLLGVYTVRCLYFFNPMFRTSFLPIYLNESPRFAASETQIGTYMTLVKLAVAVSQAALGSLIDRHGEKKIVFVSVGLLGLSYLGLIYGEGLGLLYAVGAIQGLLIAAADMAMMMQVMAVMPEGRSGMAMGLYSESENLGGIVANPVLGYIYDGSGASASMLLLMTAMTVTAASSLLLIKKKGD
ncbi:MFS transporter [Candidatus Bathyarchaeota archaeon]|nr:MFS transporter [Candidatus Bathyarchaeota archaeon]